MHVPFLKQKTVEEIYFFNKKNAFDVWFSGIFFSCFWSWPGMGDFIEIVLDLVSVEEIYLLYGIYLKKNKGTFFVIILGLHQWTLEPYVSGYDFVDPVGVSFSCLLNHLIQRCNFYRALYDNFVISVKLSFALHLVVKLFELGSYLLEFFFFWKIKKSRKKNLFFCLCLGVLSIAQDH